MVVLTRDPRPSWFKRLLGACLSVIAAILALSLMAWLTGRVVSDRYGWSQWLVWIPTPAALLAAALGAMLSLRRVSHPQIRCRRLMLWFCSLLALAAHFSFVEHRLFRAHREAAAGLRIVHWNATHVRGEAPDAYRSAIMLAEGDLTILTDAGSIPWHPDIHTWLGDGGFAQRSHPFTILSRVPILTMRVLIAKEEIQVLLLQIDTTESLGRPLLIYAADMPSDLTLPRAKLAREVRRMLDELGAPPPDLVIGDFNITRDAASLAIMFPGYRHAFRTAGAGYGATFHTRFPLYHIDHALLGEGVIAERYELRPARVGRHHMQAVTVTSQK